MYIRHMSGKNSAGANNLILPHGGLLVTRIPEEKKLEVLRENAINGFKITIDSWEESDLEMIGIGAMSPLTGFMSSRNYKSVLENMRLVNDTVWSLPVILSVGE